KDLKKTPTEKDGARILGNIVEIAEPDNGNLKLEIRVVFHDPEGATVVANTYIDLLDVFLKEKTFSVVKKNRLFLEQQLQLSKAKLDKLESELESFFKKYRIYDLKKQSQATIDVYNTNIRLLFEQKTKLEILLNYTSSRNPRIIQLQKEIGVIERKISQLKNPGATAFLKEAAQPGESAASVASEEKIVHELLPLDLLPRLNMQYDRLKKEIDIQKKIIDLMIESFENAKIQESKEDIYFTVLDRARAPEAPFKPDRRKIVIYSAVFSLFMGIFLAFAIEFIRINRRRFRGDKK
ncbi:MAG: hypothetical protein GY859_43405, partial [Desulfobacterales bacterium]|nr:hypothetical protein [Desulfobacterales bacterium]